MKKKALSSLILAALLILCGCNVEDKSFAHNTINNGTAKSGPQDADSSTAEAVSGYYFDLDALTPEETIDRATHIIDGKFVGVSETSRFKLLVFMPERAIKGSLDENAQEGIYVVSYAELEKGTEPSFIEGETYMLCLEKHISVYYDHDQYALLEDLVLSENDAQWEAYHEMAAASAMQASGAAQYGVPFTASDDPGDVMAFATNILLVRVGGAYAEGASDIAVSYLCSVEKTLKGSVSSDEIIVTFFKDTVNIGEEYVVLLADASETAPIYTLASRNSSVFSIEEALADKALADLLNRIG